MVDAPSSSPASTDVASPCGPHRDPNNTPQRREVGHDLSTTLNRAANLIRSNASDLAEIEILHWLTHVRDTDLTAAALDVISLVRTLDPASLVVGPMPPLEPARIVTTVSAGRSGPRRDYAHAIAIALRVRLHAAVGGTRFEAA